MFFKINTNYYLYSIYIYIHYCMYIHYRCNSRIFVETSSTCTRRAIEQGMREEEAQAIAKEAAWRRKVSVRGGYNRLCRKKDRGKGHTNYNFNGLKAHSTVISIN